MLAEEDPQKRLEGMLMAAAVVEVVVIGKH